MSENIFYRIYQTGKIYWEARTIIEGIGRMIYLFKGQKARESNKV